jgi:hypothetical protein
LARATPFRQSRCDEPSPQNRGRTGHLRPAALSCWDIAVFSQFRLAFACLDTGYETTQNRRVVAALLSDIEEHQNRVDKGIVKSAKVSNTHIFTDKF